MRNILIFIAILLMPAMAFAGVDIHPISIEQLDGTTDLGTTNVEGTMKITKNADEPDSVSGMPKSECYRASAAGGNLTPAMFGHLGSGCGIYYPYFDGGYDAYALTNAAILTPRWNYVTHKDNPEAYWHIGTNLNGTYSHSFIHFPEGTLTTKHGDNYRDPFVDYQFTVSGDMEVTSSDTVSGEILASNTAFNAAEWTKTGDFAAVGAPAIYTHNTGVGTLSQARGSMTGAPKNSRRFIVKPVFTITSCGTNNANLTYIRLGSDFMKNESSEANTLYGNLGAILTPGINTGWADQQAEQRFDSCSGTTCQRGWQGADNITAFTVSIATTGACTVTITELSVKEVKGGDFYLGGIITGGGTTGIAIDGNGNVGIGYANATAYRFPEDLSGTGTRTLLIRSGTAPSVNPGDTAALYSNDIAGVVGQSGLHIMDEAERVYRFGYGMYIPPTLSAPPVACSATYVNAMYSDSTTPTLCWCNSTAWTPFAAGGDCS